MAITAPRLDGDNMNTVREVTTAVAILALLVSLYIALCWVVL